MERVMSHNLPIDPIRLAIPSKGHLYDGLIEILKSAGYRIRRASDRQYEAVISGHGRFHVVFMRPADIVEQVQEGRCHLGVTGFDVYAEHSIAASTTSVVIQDLGYGGCRLVVAVPESWIDVNHVMDLAELTQRFKADGKNFRISTKYGHLTRDFFRKRGIHDYRIVASDGALELHPSLGIADIIVDLTSSGVTLKDNRLRELAGGRILDSAACLIGHTESLKSLIGEGPTSPLALLLDSIDSVRLADGRIHLEITGQSETSRWSLEKQVEKLLDVLSDHGASGLNWAQVQLQNHRIGWQIRGLIGTRGLNACRRSLLDAGAISIVGTEPRLCLEHDDHSTFESLKQALVMN
ncbi:MAG: phosphoribosyltransferase [Planctomycetota bacterium]|jgi:ATP phosphoribosyltransferase